MSRLNLHVPGLILLSLVCLPSLAIAQDQEAPPAKAAEPDRPRLELDLDEKLLVFTEPVREDGTIDYLAALNKKYSEGVTKENNAFRALYLLLPFENEWDDLQDYHAAMREVLEIGDEEIARSSRFVEWEAFAMARGIVRDAADEIEEAFADDPFAKTIHPDYQAWLDANEPVFVAAGLAVEKTTYWAPMIAEDETGLLIGVLLPHLGHYRALARALDDRASRAVVAGDEARVLDSVNTIRRLALHTSHEPFLISNLVAISLDALSAATIKQLLAERVLSRETLTGLDKMLRDRPGRVPIAQTVMEGERCFGLDAYMQIMAGRVGGDGIAFGEGGDDVLGRLAGSGAFDVNRGLKDFSRNYYQLAKIMAIKDYAARQRVVAVFEKNFDSDMIGRDLFLEFGEARLPNPALLTKDARTDAITRLMLAILFPALGSAANTETRFLATERCMLAAIACERYRLQHDRLPARLDDLIPAYLDALPIDPFNNQPIRYKRGDNGFTVYTVGHDLEDDGGFENEEDRGEGDWVFEVKWRGE